MLLRYLRDFQKGGQLWGWVVILMVGVGMSGPDL